MKELAERMEITPQQLNLTIRRGNPTLSTIRKIADALEVPMASLFEDSCSPRTVAINCPCCGGRVEIMAEASR